MVRSLRPAEPLTQWRRIGVAAAIVAFAFVLMVILSEFFAFRPSPLAP